MLRSRFGWVGEAIAAAIVGLGVACSMGQVGSGADRGAAAPASDAPRALVRAGAPRIAREVARDDRRRARARAQAAVDAARVRLARCFLEAVGRGLQGDVRVIVDLEVAADGALAAREVRTEDGLDVRGEGCVREALAGAAPAAPPPGVDVLVRLPLTLFLERAPTSPAGESAAAPAAELDRGIDQQPGAPR